MRALRVALLAFATPMVSTLAALAQRPKAVHVEVLVILAEHTDGGPLLDPKLGDLPIRQEPFVRYNSYQLLDRKELALEVGKSTADPLPNGRTLQLTLAEVTPNGPKWRFHIRAAIDDPSKAAAFLKQLDVTAGQNEPFFVAGQSYRGGTLFLEVAVR